MEVLRFNRFATITNIVSLKLTVREIDETPAECTRVPKGLCKTDELVVNPFKPFIVHQAQLRALKLGKSRRIPICGIQVICISNLRFSHADGFRPDTDLQECHRSCPDVFMDIRTLGYRPWAQYNSAEDKKTEISIKSWQTTLLIEAYKMSDYTEEKIEAL